MGNAVSISSFDVSDPTDSAPQLFNFTVDSSLQKRRKDLLTLRSLRTLLISRTCSEVFRGPMYRYRRRRLTTLHLHFRGDEHTRGSCVRRFVLRDRGYQ